MAAAARRDAAPGTAAPAPALPAPTPSHTTHGPRPGVQAAGRGRRGPSARSDTRLNSPAARRPSMSASPAAGPSRMATATARLRATTGEASARSSTSYSATIWRQSVASAAGASACTAAIAACSVYGPNRRDVIARSTSAAPSAMTRAIPPRPVLVGQQDDGSLGPVPCVAPRLVQQHQRQQPQRFGLGQQLHQQSTQAASPRPRGRCGSAYRRRTPNTPR